MYSAQTRSIFLMTTHNFRRAFKRCCASWQLVGPSPSYSRRQYLRSQLPEITDSCEARPDPGDCLLQKYPTDVRSPKTICVSPLVCEWSERASVQGFLFVSPTLSARICGNSVDCKIRSTSALFKTLTTVHLDHSGEKALVLFSDDSSGSACFHSLYSYRFRCHRKHGFCSFREKHKHLLLHGTVTQQSTKYPPRLVAFFAGLLVGP